jgi:hypothetical protein
MIEQFDENYNRLCSWYDTMDIRCFYDAFKKWRHWQDAPEVMLIF